MVGMGVEHAAAFADRRKAFARIAAVEAFLRAPAFYCGLGIPVAPDDYRASFGNANYMPYSWAGPVSAGKPPFSISQNSLPNCALFIAYAPPGGSRLADDVTLSDVNTFLPLNAEPAGNEIKSASSSGYMETNNWITFPGSIPQKQLLKVRSINGTRIGVQSLTGENISIQKNDRMHLFRVLILFVERDILYSYDYRTSGKQPRIFGIRDLRFEVDVEKQKLTAYVLARGDRPYDGPERIIGADAWPEEYLAYWNGKASEQQLFAKKIVWGLPNCTATSLLEREDAAERF